MNKASIKAYLDANIKANGVNAITGDMANVAMTNLLSTDVRTAKKLTDGDDSPTNGKLSIDWLIRYLADNLELMSLDWQTRRLFNSSSQPVLNWDVMRLIDTGGAYSLDWENRTLNDVNGAQTLSWQNEALTHAGINSLRWNTRELVNSLGNTTLDWENGSLKNAAGVEVANWFTGTFPGSSIPGVNDITHDYQLWDSTDKLSIHWHNRTLNDSTEQTAADWNNREVIRFNGRRSINWETSLLYDNSSSVYVSADYNNRTLIATGNQIVADWENRQLLDGIGVGTTAINWADRRAFNAAGFNTINWDSMTLHAANGNMRARWGDSQLVYNGFNALDWSTKELISSGNTTSLNWDSMQAFDGVGTLSIDWNGRALVDSSGNYPVRWEDRWLQDSGGVISAAWEDRRLITSGASDSLNWQNRTLIRSNGTVAFNWETDTVPSPAFLDANYHKQGGNAYGATVSIGATDNQSLVFKTNNINRISMPTGLRRLQHAADFGLGYIDFGEASTPTTISRNKADAIPGFAVDLVNASSTGLIMSFRAQGVQQAAVGNVGQFLGISLQNRSGAANSLVEVATAGTRISSNKSNTDAALRVDQINTIGGDVQQWQTAGTNVALLSKAGDFFTSASGRFGTQVVTDSVMGAIAPTHSLTVPSTGNGLALYGTTDQVTNYGRGRVYWGSNALNIAVETGGTNTNVFPINLISATSNVLVGAGGVTGGIINTRNISANANNTVVGVQGTFTNSGSIAIGQSIHPTINQSGTASYKGLLISPYEQAVGTGARVLIDAGTNTGPSVSGTHNSVFGVRASGSMWTAAIETTSGVQAINVNSRIMLDGSGTTSLDWGQYILRSAGAQASLHWGNRVAYNTSTQVTLDWQNLLAKTGTGVTTLDWGTRKVYDSTSALAMDWGVRTLRTSAGGTSLLWDARYLVDSLSAGSMDWEGRLLLGTGSGTTVDYGTRKLQKSGVGFPVTVDWENMYLRNATGTTVDWNTMYLNTPAGGGIPSVAWDERALYDAGGNQATDWNVRALISDAGTVTATWGHNATTGADALTIPIGSYLHFGELINKVSGPSFAQAIKIFDNNTGTAYYIPIVT